MGLKKKAEKRYKLIHGQLYRVPRYLKDRSVCIPKPEWCTKESVCESWSSGRHIDISTIKGTKLTIGEDSTLVYLDTIRVDNGFYHFGRESYPVAWALILFEGAVYLAPMDFCLPVNKISELQLRKLRNET